MNYISILKIVLAIWLIISSFVLGFSEVGTARWNNIIVGLILIFLVFWKLPEKTNNRTSEASSQSHNNDQA